MKQFPKKYYKKLSPEFTDAAESLSKEEIERKILEAEENIYQIDDAVDADEELNKAKEALKEMTSSYRESKAGETAKIKFLLFVIENRGQEVSTK